MKIRFLILLLLSILSRTAFSQTELCIVGTFHEERKCFNSDSVYNILTKVKPDVVLIELDSTFFTDDFHFNLKKYPDLLSTNENIGAEKYQSIHKVNLRPFDMTGRNEYYRKSKYFDNQDKMWADVLELYKKNELRKKDKEDVELILYAQELYNNISFQSAKDLNTDNTVKFLSLREKIIYPKMLSIAENTKKLHKWVDFAKEWKKHWYERNKIMADNIKTITKEYKNKRIVILVGLEHKPGLLDLLKSDKSAEFTIKEYWTY